MGSSVEVGIVQRIYDQIFDIVTRKGDKGDPPFDKETTFLQIVPNGIPINPADFANALSPTNPTGDQRAAENFAAMVDAVPAVSAEYSTTATRVDKVYGQILAGANALSSVTPEAEAQYKKAYKALWRRSKFVDVNRNVTYALAETPIYAAYKSNELAYKNAVAAYQAAYQTLDPKDPKDQEKWLQLAPLFQTNVDRAYDTWRGQGADKVEQALAIMATSINDAVREVLKQNQQDFSGSEFASLLPRGSAWHLSYALPSNWTKSDAPFTRVTLATSNVTESESSRFSTFGDSSFSKGLWRVDSSSQSRDSFEQRHPEVSNLRIDMELGVVHIQRPWLDGSVFSMKDWVLAGRPAGYISSGDLTNAEGTLMPLLPTAFVIARGVRISGDFGAADAELVERAAAGGATVAYGPFTLTGGYSDGDTEKKLTVAPGSGGMVVPGMQIIAWLNEIVPFCPPESEADARSSARAQPAPQPAPAPS